MFTHTPVLAALISLFLLAPGGATAQQTNASAKLKSTYETARLQIAMTFASREKAALTLYGKTVDALLADFQKSGELESYLVVEAEKKRLSAEGTAPDAAVVAPSLANAVGAYHKAVAEAKEEMNRQTTDLLKGYVTRLNALVKQLTQAGKIEDALAAQEERNKAASELADLEANLPQISKQGPTAEKEPAAKGETLTLDLGGGVKMEMVWIPPGEFMMGSPENEKGHSSDETEHSVTLSKGFWMGKYEVTQDQWERVMGGNPSKFGGPMNPVENVSWDDCHEFLRNMPDLGEKMRGPFCLPAEAEWEYACRAGTTTRFHNGDADSGLGKVAWYNDNSGETTHPVGQKAPNAWGLYDMHGNVGEWCEDWYGRYSEGAVTDPRCTSGGGRVTRGGFWQCDADRCRVGCRFNRYQPNYNVSGFIGFRVVLRPDQ